jgi:pimeloyl-ACP methyl ester carboxylesterase
MRPFPRLTMSILLIALVGSAMATTDLQAQSDIFDQVEHHYVENGAVPIHYVSAGEGPLVVFLHGFPDFWYSWRHQMAGLMDQFRVVALDLRGYNRSGQPEGVEAYRMGLLTGDVATVIRDLGEESATIVGHDWGGAVAWQFAFAFPQMTDQLVVLNLPHPQAMARELSINVFQRRASQYAVRFQEGSPDDPDIFFGNPMTPQTLAGWVTDPAARARYVEAFERSDFTAMLNYYKANYPALPEPGTSVRLPEVPRIDVPVLVFHGLQDTALLSAGLNGTWEWIDADYTLVTVPDAGHFVQQDAPELVTSTIRWWLLARRSD